MKKRTKADLMLVVMRRLVLKTEQSEFPQNQERLLLVLNKINLKENEKRSNQF